MQGQEREEVLSRLQDLDLFVICAKEEELSKLVDFFSREKQRSSLGVEFEIDKEPIVDSKDYSYYVGSINLKKGNCICQLSTARRQALGFNEWNAARTTRSSYRNVLHICEMAPPLCFDVGNLWGKQRERDLAW
jgi:hypothetical protein